MRKLYAKKGLYCHFVVSETSASGDLKITLRTSAMRNRGKIESNKLGERYCINYSRPSVKDKCEAYCSAKSARLVTARVVAVAVAARTFELLFRTASSHPWCGCPFRTSHVTVRLVPPIRPVLESLLRHVVGARSIVEATGS